jgi:hypothetical protein
VSHGLAVADFGASGDELNEPRFTGMASVFELLGARLQFSMAAIWGCQVQQILLRHYRMSGLKLKLLPVWLDFVI